ncbi:MAG: hypothetical protein AAGJ87_15585, partial [Pseudomonadota bacterium]
MLRIILIILVALAVIIGLMKLTGNDAVLEQAEDAVSEAAEATVDAAGDAVEATGDAAGAAVDA